MVKAKRDVDIKFKDSESILPSEMYRKGFVEKEHEFIPPFKKKSTGKVPALKEVAVQQEGRQ